jgi:hypothetical protein
MMPVTLEERHWLLRNLANGLVEHLGTREPPVWVEELLQRPPRVFADDFGLAEAGWSFTDAIFHRSRGGNGRILVHSELPLDERRYAIAREVLVAMLGTDHGVAIGLPGMLIGDVRESAEYFARHLLTPDSLVRAYRLQGKDLRGFAETFLIPPRIATLRWDEFTSFC